MTKKPVNLTQITTVCLTFILVISSFFGALSFASGQTTAPSTQPTGSASEIEALENTISANGGWNSSLQTIYDGIALGETTVSQLQTAVDSIAISSMAAAEAVFYWYFELSKFGVSLNATTIEAALNEVSMLPGVGGLPDDYSNYGTASFLIYNRYDLYAYQWADQLGYETSKWNLYQAYDVFKNSVNAYGKPVLYVQAGGVGWGIGYGPRYYDECAETIDMYLTFWLLGIPDGLTQAEYWWNYVNSNLWDTADYPGGAFYKYALDWTAFECEAGGMDSIISKLYYYDPSIDTSNLFTDMETRALSQGWSSPQWADYVVVHATGVGDSGGGNPQERLENTIMSWAAMLGLYGNMTGTMQTQVQNLLNGSTGAAWSLLLDSEVYDNSNGMFRIRSDASDSVEATADAAVLMMLLSTVPISGSLAVPIEDSTYEDINNIIDGGIININLTSQTVTIGVSQAGTFQSMFGTDIFQYNLTSPGIWKLTFSNDWNNITSETLISALPTTRIYLGTANPNSLTIYASYDNNSIINPSGNININKGGNQTFSYSADSGCTITQVLVDGSPVPITGTYTFTDVQTPQSIFVYSSPILTATPTPSPSPTPTPTATPTPAQATATPSPSKSPASTPQTVHGSALQLGSQKWLYIVAALLVVTVAAVFIEMVLLRRRNKTHQVPMSQLSKQKQVSNCL